MLTKDDLGRWGEGTQTKNSCQSSSRSSGESRGLTVVGSRPALLPAHWPEPQAGSGCGIPCIYHQSKASWVPSVVLELGTPLIKMNLSHLWRWR